MIKKTLTPHELRQVQNWLATGVSPQLKIKVIAPDGKGEIDLTFQRRRLMEPIFEGSGQFHSGYEASPNISNYDPVYYRFPKRQAESVYVEEHIDLDEGQQIEMEEEIAAKLFDEAGADARVEGSGLTESQCAKLGRDILKMVLSTFRKDLMTTEEPEHQIQVALVVGSVDDVRAVRSKVQALIEAGTLRDAFDAVGLTLIKGVVDGAE